MDDAPVTLPGEADPTAALLEVRDLRAVLDGHAEVTRTRLEQPLRVGLRGHESEGEPSWQLAEVDVDAAEDAQSVHHLPRGDQVVGQATRIQLLERPGVNCEGSGQVRRGLAPLDKGDIHPALGKVASQQQPRRTCADDRYLRVHVYLLGSTVLGGRAQCQRALTLPESGHSDRCPARHHSRSTATDWPHPDRVHPDAPGSDSPILGRRSQRRDEGLADRRVAVQRLETSLVGIGIMTGHDVPSRTADDLHRRDPVPTR